MKTVRQMSAFQLAFFAVFTVTIMMATTIVAQRSTAITYQLPHKQPKIQWENLDKQNFSVPLDHFSPLNAQHGNFTYVQQLDCYRSNGPIFIYINDAGLFTTEFLFDGLMRDIACEVGAALITADNRYFRSNLPTTNASTPNLQYLTVDQTIRDISLLIGHVKENLSSPRARIVLWGTGHGATLATWTKQKYPHLISGVWSSSGVYETTVYTTEPFESLSRTVRTVGGDECAENVRRAFETMTQLIEEREFRVLANRLRTCYWPYYAKDVAAFFMGLTQLLIDYVNIHHYKGIISFCSDMAIETPESEFVEFDAFARWVQRVFTPQICLDVTYFSRIYEASFTDWKDIAELAWSPALNVVYPFVSRSLFYLRCSQLGLFAISSNDNKTEATETLFGNATTPDMYAEGCTAVFDVDQEGDFDFEQLESAINELTVRFGGKNPGVTDVIYTNGMLDTHFSFGITEADSRRQPHGAFVRDIPYYAKSADLFSITENDSIELKEAKEDVRMLVKLWSGIE